MLETVNPATGEVLATFPVQGRREVDAAVAAAREAAVWWAGLGWSGRRIRLLAWKSHLTRYMGRLAQLVHEETGKPLDDAKLEIILAILHIDWAARHARRVLRPRRVRSGLAAIHQAATVEYQPLGVVGVIGPWNYPVFTPVGSIAYARRPGTRSCSSRRNSPRPPGRRWSGRSARRLASSVSPNLRPSPCSS